MFDYYLFFNQCETLKQPFAKNFQIQSNILQYCSVENMQQGYFNPQTKRVKTSKYQMVGSAQTSPDPQHAIIPFGIKSQHLFARTILIFFALNVFAILLLFERDSPHPISSNSITNLLNITEQHEQNITEGEGLLPPLKVPIMQQLQGQFSLPLGAQQLQRFDERNLRNASSEINRYIKYVHIQGSSQYNECLMVHGLRISDAPKDSIISILNQLDRFQSITIFYLNDKNEEFLKKIFKEKQIEFKGIETQIDPFYQFINKPMGKCSHIAVVHAGYELQFNDTNIVKFRQQIKQDAAVYFTKQHNLYKWETDLFDLNETNISSLSEQELLNYLIVFDPKLLKVLSPLNFASCTAYTFSELFLYPLLASTAQSPKLIPLLGRFYSIPSRVTYPSHQLFEFTNNREIRNHYCFISIQTTPTTLNVSQTKKYLDTFKKFGQKNSTTVVLSLPFHFNASIWSVISYGLQITSQMGLKIVFRIRDGISKPSIEILDASYNYCPLESRLIFSRTDVEFDLKTIYSSKEMKTLCNAKNSFVLMPAFSLNKKVLKFEDSHIKFIDTFYKQKGKGKVFPQFKKLYSERIQWAQFFCSNAFRTFAAAHFQMYPRDFYENQIIFVYALMKWWKPTITFTNSSFFSVSSGRNLTEREKQEQKVVRMALQKITLQLKAVPVKFDTLLNIGYRRDAPKIVPKIVHQAFLTYSDSIPRQRQLIGKSFTIHNPTYKYVLWQMKDITRKNFPYTYDSIQKLFEYQKNTPEANLKSYIADLMRMEILYWYGGFYFDFKMQATKSFEDLRYFSFGAYRLANRILDKNGKQKRNAMLMCGVCISSRGNPQIRRILTESFVPEKIIVVNTRFLPATDGRNTAASLTQYDLDVRVINFRQFVTPVEPECSNPKVIEPDQEQFEDKTRDGKNAKYWMPCKHSKYKYIQHRSIIGGGSYLRNGSNDNYQ